MRDRIDEEVTNHILSLNYFFYYWDDYGLPGIRFKWMVYCTFHHHISDHSCSLLHIKYEENDDPFKGRQIR